jgi:hypothetical protein
VCVGHVLDTLGCISAGRDRVPDTRGAATPRDEGPYKKGALRPTVVNTVGLTALKLALLPTGGAVMCCLTSNIKEFV